MFFLCHHTLNVLNFFHTLEEGVLNNNMDSFIVKHYLDTIEMVNNAFVLHLLADKLCASMILIGL